MQIKTRKEIPMTEDVKISITIEIENGQKITAEFVIQSVNFKFEKMTGEAILESCGYQIRRDQNRVLGKMSYFEEKNYKIF